MAGRELWAMLHLVDRQLLDRDGVSAGKVDDLSFREPQDDEELPVLTHMLTGAAALAKRFSPALGREVQRIRCIERAEAGETPPPAQIPMSAVRDIRAHIQLGVARDDLDVTRLDRWFAHAILAHVPGSGIKTR